MNKIRIYCKLLRIHHYIKNFLIFLPLVCSGNALNIMYLKKALIGFICFSMVASAIYIINDLQDISRDKLHPIKCTRPIASGEVSIKKAKVISIILIMLSSLIELLINGSIIANILLLIYFILNLLYSFYLKNIVFVDLIILVSGFFIRVLYGGTILNIVISSWLYLTVIAASFYLALGKRRNEILKTNTKGREVLKHYSLNFLDRNMYMCASLSIVFYSLWCIDKNTIEKLSEDIIWSVPLLLLLFMRYSFNIEKDSFGDPVDVIFHDKVLLSLALAFGVIFLFFMYRR